MTRWNDGRRALVLTGALLLAGCGGRVAEVTGKTDPPPSGDVCTSVFACPGGQRCDEGVCVPDTTCPAAIAPRLVYKTNGSETFEAWTAVTLQGRDLVQLTAQSYLPPKPVDHETFLDVLTGELSTWPHASGLGLFFPCSQGVCAQVHGTDDSVSIEVGLELHDGVWSTQEHHPVPDGYASYGDDRFFGPGTWLLASSEMVLSKWTLATGAIEPVLPLDGRTFWSVRSTPEGWQVLGHQRNFETHVASWSTTVLGDGATWTPLFDVQGPWYYGSFLVRAGDQWFAILDPHETGGEARYRVYRVGPGGQTETGNSTDQVIFELGEPSGKEQIRLGADHVGRAVSCLAGRCRLMSVDLDAVKVTEHAAVDLGTLYLSAVRTRWLACNAVDVLVGSYEADPVIPGKVRPGALWYTRMVP